MLTSKIKITNFKTKKQKKYYIYKEIKKINFLKRYKFLISLTNNYKNNYKNLKLKKLKKIKNINLIGMGGSILGSKAIYSFLRNKIKKNFQFIDNLNASEKSKININKNINIIISKSGNTLETISNFSLIKKKQKNIFITERTNNHLYNLAMQTKSEIVEHKNYIGGRYSVLSEVGMLPAELMGLNVSKFKQFNNLIKNKRFILNLITNVNATLNLLNEGKFNSIILNYDPKSEDLFKWYQQLIAESLGKKSKGIMPILSSMPKDNHSILQLYLDGPKKNFYTFFDVFEKNSNKIKNDYNNKTFQKLKNKSIYDIVSSQKAATMKVFSKKQLPFRNFHILKRDEQSIGELFCFFILETILLGKALKVNPFDQPSVELIKIETKKILL
tara:strand:+ start:400 stop:1560 length:1161 start_codon:yes stop_codon:yes gene_type:complete